MKKYYYSLICFIYSSIIFYVYFTNKIKNFLAPNMQKYLIISIIPLLIMGIGILFDKHKSKIKISDLFLLLPIILLIISADGKVSNTFANNRMSNFTAKKKNSSVNKSKNEEEKIENITVDIIMDENEEENTHEYEYDFSNVDFNVIDDSYMDLANYITFAPKASRWAGKTIRVRGFATKNKDYVTTGFFAIGKIAISCCVADAEFVGFIAKENNFSIVENSWYEVEGVLSPGKFVDGSDIMIIDVKNLKEIDGNKEEQNVYPCYSYDDGACVESSKYDLEY